MTPLASHLSTFLREYLPRDRAASTHTCEAYSYSLMLLLRFASERLRVTPSQIDLAQVDAPLVLAFLTDIEKGRGNTERVQHMFQIKISDVFARNNIDLFIPLFIQTIEGMELLNLFFSEL